MNLQLLIDAIMRQTTILIAQIATSGGLRAPLAHIADQVFLELAKELDQQGVSRKVSADMFGMALRTYLRRVRRLRESSTSRGDSLWESLLRFLNERGVATRAEVLERFYADDEQLVRSVLIDLVDSGLVFRSGSGNRVAYRAASPEELRLLGRSDEIGRDELIWALVFSQGTVTREELLQSGALAESELDMSLRRLTNGGRVASLHRNGTLCYRSRELVIPIGSKVGWEGAVFDHFQALVRTVIGRVSREGQVPTDDVGGSTYHYDIWRHHPLESEVTGSLNTIRELLGNLRQRVEQFNNNHDNPAETRRVTVYVGQCSIEQNLDAENTQDAENIDEDESKDMGTDTSPEQNPARKTIDED